MKGSETIRPIKAIVFDLFHTLVDPEEFRPKEFHRAEAVADILKIDRREFLAFWVRTRNQRMTTPAPEMEYVKDFLVRSGRKVPPSFVIDKVNVALGCYQDIALLRPQAEVLESLKWFTARGYRLGLLSNTYERDVWEWPRSPLSGSFYATAFSHETGHIKPEREAYLGILERLDLDATACAYVGDGGSQELNGARHVGFRRVIFMRKFVSKNGLRSPEELEETARDADFVADSFKELSEGTGLQGRHD